VSALSPERRARAEQLIALYPQPRSALIPLCHLAQEEEGYLTPSLMRELAEMVGVTPAEVQGTVSFYDMLHTEPVGDYVVGVCTNIACLLAGGLELLQHAEAKLGVRAGGTTADGRFTLEETECLADCDVAPCVQVNSRFVRTTAPEDFDQLIDELAAGGSARDIPSSGTLNRVVRSVGLVAHPEEVAAERAALRAEASEVSS
jgi:NADH-quinone oxidoreductase E subunit